uniref:Uncharacterized protein n=1 Tax=Mesocestoides corti TaxID=53468 RepID=A0A5K3EI81_MESCO
MGIKEPALTPSGSLLESNVYAVLLVDHITSDVNGDALTELVQLFAGHSFVFRAQDEVVGVLGPRLDGRLRGLRPATRLARVVLLVGACWLQVGPLGVEQVCLVLIAPRHLQVLLRLTVPPIHEEPRAASGVLAACRLGCLIISTFRFYGKRWTGQILVAAKSFLEFRGISDRPLFNSASVGEQVKN